MKKSVKFFGWFLLLIGVILLFDIKFSSIRILIFISLGLILIFHEKMEHFELLSLKIKLRNTINEAEEIITKLKAISVPLARCSLTSLIAVGRTSCIGNKEKFFILDETLNGLKSLGCGTNDILKARELFDKLICHDIARPIFSHIRNNLKKKHDELIHKLSAVPSNSPIKNSPEYVKFSEEQKQVWEEIQCLDNLASFTSQKVSRINDVNNFLSSTKYISKGEVSEIKNKLRIDLENLQTYEREGEFYDNDYFIERRE
ncbi:MAG: hypothetical protein A2X78_01960 [Gammaproteobacteria bacterium GWE2_37_16]|nr:MAG: hypothetical protein A2X78_01960 [Gammaproteobacteria bacterium GWE2_37_16]